MVYATVLDLETRFRPLSDEEKARAAALLEDAAVIIDAAASSAPDHAKKLVSCAMVKRAMAMPGGEGVSSYQQGAGSYTESQQFANPTGDLYLTKSERKTLGASKQRAFEIALGGSE